MSVTSADPLDAPLSRATVAQTAVYGYWDLEVTAAAAVRVLHSRRATG